jgi:hypothetical protein
MSDSENDAGLKLTPESHEKLKSLVSRSQKVMAHGWMIRTIRS